MAKKILLIEYEPRYLDRIRGHLAGKDFDLVVAKDGEEGLDAYRKSRPDLVLISSVLPKLRTPDVIKGMQSLGAPPPILLMMSGYKGKNKKSDAERVGATSILEKPFSEEVFLSEISSALGSGAAPLSGDGGAPLLSADDIFSDVLSGMDDEPRPAPTPGGTDPGIQKKLEQTLSGILPSPKRVSSAAMPRIEVPPTRPTEQPVDRLSTGSQTVRVGALSTPQPPSQSGAVRAAGERAAVEASVDKMLTDTLSGLKNAKALADRGATSAAPKPAPDRGLDALERLSTSDRLKAAKPPAPVAATDRTERLDMRADVSAPAEAKPAAPRPAPAPAPPAPVVAPPPAAPEPARSGSQPGLRGAEAAQAKSGPLPPPARKEERRREPSQHGTAAAAPQTGSFGRYTLLEKIAAGGMAEVFKARMRGEEGFEKIVAIKRILPHMADNDDFITMFVDEAKLAAQLTHNNIIHIYDLGKVEQYHYIAMEYVEGKDLRSILKLGSERDFALPPELALFVASKIANALDYAHRRLGIDGKELNLVHRDVSPQNILISFEGDIKLCDFGIAKAATKVSQTQTGALKGKLQYMSPEQAWGKKIDRRTDIFSLGIVLFEMLTGERLFTGDTDLTILEQVRDAKVVAPSTRNPDVPKKVDQIVLKALAKNPQDRYQNASELERDINQVLYSYQPTPGPADLAIYMHRLLDASPAASDEQIDRAFAKAEQAPVVAEPQKKGKGLVIAKKAPAPERAPEPPAPAPVEVSRPALSMGREPAKSRTGLYAGIGIAAVVLVAVGVFVTRKKPETAPSPAPPVASSSAPAPAPQPTQPAAAPAASAPTKIIDPKAVEAEAKRLAALKQQELLAAAKKPTVPVPAPGSAKAQPAQAPVSVAPKQPVEPPKVAEQPAPTKVVAERPAERPTEPPPPPPRPTEPPVRVAEARPAPAEARPAPADVPPSSAAVREGDLVGPGEGVVEPKIVRMGAFTNLPPQLKQMSHGGSSLGTLMISALITENGSVADTRIAKASAYKAVDEAAINALKSSKIEPATKNGVRVKMWKTFTITVKP